MAVTKDEKKPKEQIKNPEPIVEEKPEEAELKKRFIVEKISDKPEVPIEQIEQVSCPFCGGTNLRPLSEINQSEVIRPEDNITTQVSPEKTPLNEIPDSSGLQENSATNIPDQSLDSSLVSGESPVGQPETETQNPAPDVSNPVPSNNEKNP